MLEYTNDFFVFKQKEAIFKYCTKEYYLKGFIKNYSK